MSMQNKPETLTESQRQLLLGTMLGDGSMRLSSAFKQTVNYRSRHGWCQHQYNLEKYALLTDYATKPPYKTKNGGYGEWSSVWRTKALSVFHSIFNLTCPDGQHKLVNPEWLSQLTPEGIAWWVGDDGSLQTGGRRTITISTHGFSHAEVHLLADWLLDVYHVGSKVYTVNKKRDGKVFQYPVLHVTAAGTKTLCELITPYMPKPMLYKVDRRILRCAMCETEVEGNLTVCSDCKEEWTSIRKQEYYTEHKEEIQAKARDWKLRNPERVSEINKRSYYKDWEHSKALGRKNAAKYQEENRDEINERKRGKRAEMKGDPTYEELLREERARYYVKLRKDPVRWRAHLDTNNIARKKPERRKAELAYTKEWRAANPDKVREQDARAHQRMKEKLANDPVEKERQHLMTNARNRRKTLAKGPTGQCKYCGEPLYNKNWTICKADVCQNLKQEAQKVYRLTKQKIYRAQKKQASDSAE